MGYSTKKSKFNRIFKKATAPIQDNVKFPSEGGNKIWDSNIRNKFKVNMSGKYGKKR
jgi:hypothetical protein